jgi:taurine-pyruvate aminotransferase
MDTKDAKIRELVEKDERYVWHAMSRYTPVEGGGTAPAPRIMVTEGEGAWISDAEGNRYLDGMSGLWCVNVGYGREELAKAAYDQLVKLPYYPLTMGHEPAVELGEKLNEWLDDEYVVFYSNSGSEANETAFKVARQYHEQNGEPRRWRPRVRPCASTATSHSLPASCTSRPLTATAALTATTAPRATWSAPGP